MKTTLLFILLACSLHGQEVHHQMISSQGTSSRTATGLIVKQTIGQQSNTGTSSNSEMIIQQGFQQSFWQKHITETKDIGLVVTTFPNPFDQVINFQFSSVVAPTLTIVIFDIAGRLVFSRSLVVSDNKLTLDLSDFPSAEYLVRISGDKINYFTKIIKK